MTARGNGGHRSESFSRICAGTLAVAALVLLGDCDAGGDDDATETVIAALTTQDVLGFESVAVWTPSSGTEALTTTRTQGVSAYALTAPVNFTNIVGAPVDNTTPNLQGLTNAGSRLALDMVIPTQQPNAFFFGSVQLVANAPSRSVFNQFIAQVELTGLPLGSFQTLRFSVPDSLRNSLRGATFNDLSFIVALNAPSGATGTYIFDNLRAVQANNAEFSLTPSPAAVTVVQGATAQSTIAVGRAGGFAAGVTLSATGLPAGVTATFNPATATGASSVVTFAAGAGAALGPATVTITGTGGGLSRTATISLTVAPGPAFTLAASPAALTVGRGAMAQSTVTITRQNGFAAAVAFSASGLPTGVTATFAPASTTGTTSVATFTAAANATLGTATVTITGTGGGLTRTTSVALTVAPAPDFALTASPAAVTVVLESTATSTITVTPLNGFAAAVAFSAAGLPAGVSATFNPASAIAATVVTFTASAAAVPGTATVTITGLGGGLVRSTTIALTVAPPAGDFSLEASPAGLTLAVGASATTTIAITRLDGFPATINFSAGGLPSGVVATFVPPATTGDSTTLTLTALDTAVPGPATVTITGTGGALTRTTALTLLVTPAVVGDFSLAANPSAFTISQGDALTGTITITRTGGFGNAVSFTANGLPGGVTATFNPATTADDSVAVTFTASAGAAPGPATVTVTGTGGGLVRTTTISLVVNAAPAGDFALSASPAGLTLGQGESAPVLITIDRLGGFASDVSFSAAGLADGVTATFLPPDTTGDAVTLLLAATPTAATGPATIIVTGAGGGLTRTVPITLLVNPGASGDFELAAIPTAYGINAGDAASGLVTINRFGLPGPVAFEATGLPAGVAASFSPSATTDDQTVITLTVAPDAPTTFSTVTIVGSSGGLVRTVPVTLLVNGS